MSKREGGRVGTYQGVWRQSKLEAREGAPGEVEVAEGAPGEVRARGPATSLEIEVGEGAPMVEPERTARPGSTNPSPRRGRQSACTGRRGQRSRSETERRQGSQPCKLPQTLAVVTA